MAAAKLGSVARRPRLGPAHRGVVVLFFSQLTPHPYVTEPWHQTTVISSLTIAFLRVAKAKAGWALKRSARPSKRTSMAATGGSLKSILKSRAAALDKASAAARLHRASLVVSKVDRLTRSVAFLSRLLEAGVDVRFADLPQIEGTTGRFMLQQMVAVAELEAGMISARTKAALAQAKKRGVKLGGNRGVKPTAKMRALSKAALQRRADARAAATSPRQ